MPERFSAHPSSIAIERALYSIFKGRSAELLLRIRAGEASRNDDGESATHHRFALMDGTIEAVRRTYATRDALEVADGSRSAGAVFETGAIS